MEKEGSGSMETCLDNTFWVAKDLSIANEVIEICSVAYPRAAVKIWTSPETFIDSWMPTSFFDEKDSLLQPVTNKEAGFDLFTPKALRIESASLAWLTTLADAIAQGNAYFETSSPDIKKLAEAAAARMGKVINIKILAEQESS